MSARVAVVQFAGVNCENETARALAAVGLVPEVVRWTADPGTLATHDAYVLPGGFSYQDRVRAGAVAARHRFLETIAERAARGLPVLGICNGAQILVEAGLVPGRTDEARLALALAPNHMPDRTGYLARWVWCEVQNTSSLFTQAYAPGERVPLPMAHGEGRFTTRDEQEWEEIERAGLVPLRYVAPGESAGSAPFPWNPNGSLGNAAAVGNRRGNVLALMPHPERAQALAQVPLDLPGPWGERRRRVRAGEASPWSAGPGAGIFLSLASALGARTEGLPAFDRELRRRDG